MDAHVTTELKLLGAAVIIGLVQIFASAHLANQQRGIDWGVGPRDEPRPLAGVAGRLQRALANFGETFPLFAAAILAVHVAGKLGALTLYGAWLYVIGRALFVLFYATGTVWVRTLVWLAAVIGIVMVTVALFL